MSDFSFTATAECDLCGAFLSSSDEDCDHNGASVETFVFRKMGEGRESIQGVRATPGHRWHKLAEAVDDDWRRYQYIATKESMNTMLNGPVWDSVEELPHQSMSLDAPSDVD